MARRNRPATDPATKAAALRLASEIGVSAASNATGIPTGTLKAWRHRTGEAGPPSGADPVKWQANKREGAQRAFETAQEALSQVRRALKAGQMRNAREAAIVMAVLVDKSGILEAGAQQQDDRVARLGRERAEVMRDIVQLAFRSIGIPWTPGSPAALLVAGILRSHEETDAMVADPVHAAAVEAQLREKFETEVREQLMRELRSQVEPEWMAEHRGLPAGEPDEDEEVVDGELLPPRRVVRTTAPEPDEVTVAASGARPVFRPVSGLYRSRYGASEFS